MFVREENNQILFAYFKHSIFSGLFVGLYTLAHSQSTYPILDSIDQYIENQSQYSEQALTERFIDFSNAIFNQYSTGQIDTISIEIESKLDRVEMLKPKVILHQIRCAYLSNSSQLDAAEQCESQVLEWAETSGRSDIKLLALEDLNFIYNHQGRYDEQINILHQAIKISIDLDLPLDRIYYFAWLGEALSYRAQYDSAYHYLDEGLSLATIENDSALLANVYERYARVALDQGNYPQSISYSQRALEIAQLKGMKIREETNLIYSAYNFFYLGDYESAIDYELQALALYENKEDPNTASIYSRLGNIYNSLENYKVALDYLQKAKKIYSKTNYDVGMAKTDLNLADTYHGMEDYEQAEKAAQGALIIFQSLKDEVNLSNTYRKLAKIELSKNRCELSQNWIKESILFLEKTKKYAALAPTYLETAQIGEACNLRGINPYQYAKMAYEISNEIGDALTQMKASEMLYRYSEKAGNNEEALSYQKEYLSTYKALYNQRNQEATTREQARFNVQLADEKRRAAELESDLLKTRNNFLKWIAIGMMAFALLMSYLIFQLFKSQKQLKTQNALINTQNAELSSLNDFKDKLFSIISHDLRTPFSAIQTIPNQLRKRLAKDDTEGTHKMIDQFENRTKSVNSLLQNLLQWSLIQMQRQVIRKQKIHVEDEILDALDLYESIASEKGIKITTGIRSDLLALGDSNGFQTICRNLIHNAIKYSPENGKIEVVTKEEGKFIKVSVRDYGQGMTSEAIDRALKGETTSTRGTSGEKGTGLGMIVMNDIVKSNNGYFSLENMEPGLIASFKFPSYGSASD